MMMEKVAGGLTSRQKPNFDRTFGPGGEEGLASFNGTLSRAVPIAHPPIPSIDLKRVLAVDPVVSARGFAYSHTGRMPPTTRPLGKALTARFVSDAEKPWRQIPQQPYWETLLRRRRVSNPNSRPSTEGDFFAKHIREATPPDTTDPTAPRRSGGRRRRITSARDPPPHVTEGELKCLRPTHYCSAFPRCREKDPHCQNCLDAGLSGYEVVARDAKVEHITKALEPIQPGAKGIPISQIAKSLDHQSHRSRGSLLVTQKQLYYVLINCQFPQDHAAAIVRDYNLIGKDSYHKKLHMKCFLEEYIRGQWLLVLRRLHSQYQRYGESMNVHVRISVEHLRELLCWRLGDAKATEEMQELLAGMGRTADDTADLTWEEVVTWYCHKEQGFSARLQRYKAGRESLKDHTKSFTRGSATARH